jgi:hypothetical protein
MSPRRESSSDSLMRPFIKVRRYRLGQIVDVASARNRRPAGIAGRHGGRMSETAGAPGNQDGTVITLATDATPSGPMSGPT